VNCSLEMTRENSTGEIKVLKGERGAGVEREQSLHDMCVLSNLMIDVK
jgi:hypothetical protein